MNPTLVGVLCGLVTLACSILGGFWAAGYRIGAYRTRLLDACKDIENLKRDTLKAREGLARVQGELSRINGRSH